MASKGGINQFAQGRSDLYKIDPADIVVVNGFNARNFDDPANMEHIEELAASISQVGVKVPLRVRFNNGVPELVDGECRLRAAMLARSRGVELLTVPVMTEDRYANDADLVLMQLTANSGKNFTPLEKAEVMKRLLAHGWTETKIAEKVGISRLRVTQLLELSAAPSEVTRMVSEGKISATLAIETMRDAKGDDQKAVATLQAGVEQAAKAGKSRATKKDMASPAPEKESKPNFKAQRDRLFKLFEAAFGDAPDIDWIRDQVAQLRIEAGLDKEAVTEVKEQW
ncbi:ParB/RepB/Spo0J family partition protein [Sinirhodobacter populi]|uniref:ParB/RepB/Spo0J family partition protein n=1 Tax=Paenirhodobacter populi TaxID=2306993 RepID=A0A443KCC4_9RHOB|nr:ParB/RepB/Spo0J family partition protein [Sinirhodobacter populi]RWR30457.1 ParB/RepB/Spo0J family partition protein [Sinirhodobacter populi]